jgi:hypothetical protein
VSPRHLDLSQRMAFAARMSIAIELEARPLQAGDRNAIKTQDLIRRSLVSEAELLQTGPPRLDEALKKLAGLAKTRSVHGQGVAFDDLRARLIRLSDDLAQVSCRKCARSEAGICKGDPAHDQLTVSTRGHCIAKLRDLVRCVDEQARRIYAEAADQMPTVDLSTATTHEDKENGLFRQFNIGAQCEVQSDSKLTSIVTLIIKESHFDWNVLCLLPYIVAHEVVCHAFQDLHSGKRAGADEKCVWSEGWMDRFAYVLTLHWLDKARFPSWLMVDPVKVADQTNHVHLWRYAPRDSLTKEDAAPLHDVRNLFDEVRKRWGRDVSLDGHRISKFTARLNAAPVSNQLREDIAMSLGGLMRNTSAREKFELALGACSGFVADGDAEKLLNYLKYLEKTPIDKLR